METTTTPETDSTTTVMEIVTTMAALALLGVGIYQTGRFVNSKFRGLKAAVKKTPNQGD